jgi:hypothetical protein
MWWADAFDNDTEVTNEIVGEGDEDNVCKDASVGEVACEAPTSSSFRSAVGCGSAFSLMCDASWSDADVVVVVDDDDDDDERSVTAGLVFGLDTEGTDLGFSFGLGADLDFDFGVGVDLDLDLDLAVGDFATFCFVAGADSIVLSSSSSSLAASSAFILSRSTCKEVVTTMAAVAGLDLSFGFEVRVGLTFSSALDTLFSSLTFGTFSSLTLGAFSSSLTLGFGGLTDTLFFFLGLGTTGRMSTLTTRTTRPDEVFTTGGGVGAGGRGATAFFRGCLPLVFFAALGVMVVVVADDATAGVGVDAGEATEGPRNGTNGATGEARPEDDVIGKR